MFFEKESAEDNRKYMALVAEGKEEGKMEMRTVGKLLC